MLKSLGRILNKIINPLGYTIIQSPKIIPSSIKDNWAEKLDIRTIIDIGSNEGQFIKEISKLLPGRKIIAFEPIASCYKKLITNTKKLDILAYNIGLSDIECTSEINISNNSGSSSILDMEDLHKTSYPDSYYVKKEKIQLRKLDDALGDIDLQKNILIKMDVQGYEKNVIKGGEKTFASASALIIESIFEPFYDTQWLFDDLYKHFSDSGFKFLGFAEQVNSKKNGIPLYADSIFIKKDLIRNVL